MAPATRFSVQLTSLVALALSACGGQALDAPNLDDATGGGGTGGSGGTGTGGLFTGGTGPGGAGTGGSVGGGATGGVGSGGAATQAECLNNGRPSLVRGLEPVDEVDYLDALRWYGSAYEAMQSTGSACAGADDFQTCMLAYGDRLAEVPAGLPLVLTYTRGSEGGVIATSDELTSFLGVIDTPNEAILVLEVAGYGEAPGPTIGCSPFTTLSPEYCWLQSSASQCGSGCCPGTRIDTTVCVQTQGSIVQTSESVTDYSHCLGGRRPQGLRSAESATAADPRGAYFKKLCALETASVAAFAQIAAELRRHGAPHDLILRAERAASDEVRHAAETARAARRFGAELDAVRVEAQRERSLLAMALENAEEGCVRETFGAALAHFSAQRAEDTELRLLWTRIAEDETRHAELSRDIGAWLSSRLLASERALVAARKYQALARLRQGLGKEPDGSVARTAGVPTSREAHILLESLAELLTSAA